MPVAVRYRADAAPTQAPLPHLIVRQCIDAAMLAALLRRDPDAVQKRFDDGHRAYVAWYEGQAAAFGWVATRRAEIGELQTGFEIPATHRYLWNFVTLPSHRGLGIYPRLLDAIVQEESDAEVFWIARAPENRASARGIEKAGFTTVASLSFDARGRSALGGSGNPDARRAARVLGLPVVPAVTPCWKCVRAGRRAMSCPESQCRCDYQKPELPCA